MMLSLRVDQELQRALERAARLEGLSKSQLIRQCLESYLARHKADRLPWDLGKDVFGKAGSGRSDLSRNRKQILRQKIHAKKGCV